MDMTNSYELRTLGLVGEMSKHGSDLKPSNRHIEVQVSISGFKERVTGVKSFSGAASTGLAKNSVKEFVRHNPVNRLTTFSART